MQSSTADTERIDPRDAEPWTSCRPLAGATHSGRVTLSHQSRVFCGGRVGRGERGW